MILNLNFKNHGSYLISVVHSRYASDLTVTISLSKRLQVLIKDPNAIGVSSKFQWSPVVVVEVDGAPSGIRPQWGPSNERFTCISCK
jgi:hypothetical protein